MSNWHDDLCEYYSVDAETALELGTRATGRTPDLPASKTCKAVSGMTYEDIWALSDRKTTESVFQFYHDQGAWSTFRQCVRHKDMSQYHIQLIGSILNSGTPRVGYHICEYGCGVAPFLNSFVSFITADSSRCRISITDVEGCEHFNFAEWRLKKKISERSLNIDLNIKPVTPTSLPAYDEGLDLVLIFEVLEHVPSPLATIKNIYNQLNDGGIILENFIKHDDDHDDDGPDLRSAAIEREEYYSFLSKNFELIVGRSEADAPNETRAWRKK